MCVFFFFYIRYADVYLMFYFNLLLGYDVYKETCIYLMLTSAVCRHIPGCFNTYIHIFFYFKYIETFT